MCYCHLASWTKHVRHFTTIKEENHLSSMNIRCSNIIPTAFDDKFIRFIPKREWEFNQCDRQSKRGNARSAVSLDISMNLEPYYSAEEKKVEPTERNSTQSVGAAEIGGV